MAFNNMFSTGFNSGFGTGFGVGTGWGDNQSTAQTKAPTKQQKFPGLNQQQIANIEKYTANLTGAEKKQEQQKIYQAMIQAIEAENFNDNRMAVNNERYRNSLSKTDPRECKFDQSACRQSALVDLVKDARNLRANTDENTVMQMFMQEMDYRGIGMDKLNAYLDSGDESILYETGLKSQRGGTKDLINQAGATGEESRGEKNLREKGEAITNNTNIVGLGAEKLDDAAGKFADKYLDFGNQALESTSQNLKEKLENMSKEEVAQYRKQYEKLLKDKDFRTAQVRDTGTLVGNLWERIKGDVYYDYDDEEFMKWLISQKANLWESMSGADNFLAGETDPNVIQLFGNIPSSALKTFTATVRGMSNPYDTMKGMYLLGKDVYDNGFENSAIGQRYGSWGAFAKALNEDPVGVADDALAVAELVAGGVKGVGKLTGNESLVAKVNNLNIGSANDVLADRLLHGGNLTLLGKKTVNTKGLYGVMDSTLGDKGLVGNVNKVLQTESDLGKMTEAAKDAYKAVANSNFVDELINKMVGIDKEDRAFIKENKDLVNNYISGKKNVDTVYDNVKGKLDEKILERIETGKEYEKIYKNKKKIVDTEGLTNDKKLIKNLKKSGVSVDADGNLVFEKINDFDAKQQKALQDAWQDLKNVESEKKLNSRQTLGQRRKIDNKINWEGKPEKMSASDIVVESLIKDMRGTLDARAKQYIPGLKELDAKYQPLVDEVRQIKKDWFNSDGTIKDNARSKIRNLTKAGNEARLERLEKIAPGITQDLKALDAALTVEKLTKNSVGQYYKGGGIALGIKSLFSGNIPAAIGFTAVGILATPKNFVKLIQREPAIASKLMNGDTLTSSDISRLQAIASRLEDGIEIEEE